MSSYSSRETKPKWIFEHFSGVFEKTRSVLDVGCDRKQMEAVLPSHIQYTGMDISEEADIQFDLDSQKRLPIADREFDVVLSLDTLEHLEHIHFVFDEICRVSKQYILVSLPNPLSGIIPSYGFGKKYSTSKEQRMRFGTYMKFYGLPLEKPLDRHRWFFGAEEAVEFIKYRAAKNAYKIIEVTYAIDFEGRLKKIIKSGLTGFNTQKTMNFFSGTIMFLLEREYKENYENKFLQSSRKTCS